MDDFNEGLDGKLACRMRRVHGEQFLTLVRMHLSFELDLNTEENEVDVVTEKGKLKKWGILNFSKKPKTPLSLQKGSEGATLTKEGLNQVKHLVEYLSKDQCINQEGIFRRTGKLTRQQELKNALYQGQPLDLDEGRFSVHDCASVLKGFLADLPEPLLSDLHYPAHCQIAEWCTSTNNDDDSRLLRSLQLLLLLLPPPNRILLKLIIGLLNKTAAHENSNKMNCDTLATLFTPHLLCPRKLTPEALHVNSQNLSGLVSFMIKKGNELFEIPPKLSTDIRAFWVEQEKKLLSPQKPDLNESTVDRTGTAHTVFSFVDRDLTAQATASQDTQAALAQLYAHIQSMPESSKKRRLVKQFNKENGQGTPRHVKLSSSGGSGGSGAARSFGDSIKKRIFHKKLLNHKKIIDVKFGCNFSRSSSEENIISGALEGLPKVLSKSEDELNAADCQCDQGSRLLKSKPISSSTGSLHCAKPKITLKSYLDVSESETTRTKDEIDLSNPGAGGDEGDQRLSRHQSEPPNMYSSQACDNRGDELLRLASDPTIRSSEDELASSGEQLMLSPATKNKLRCLYAAHTSTPSNLLRKSLALPNDYILTPISDDDKSMSPISQSATKMTKAMQETMMTPRSRKPVIMVSASNICGLANGSVQYDSTMSLQTPNFDLVNKKNYSTVIEESPTLDSNSIARNSNGLENKENTKIQDTPEDQNYVTCLEDVYENTIQQTIAVPTVNTLKEYFLSRSVLTASPVDLSFTSRTGDFEQSESDSNVLAEENNNPGSDTSGIATSSTNSVNNSLEKTEEGNPSPRKRCTSLQRNDSKRSIKDETICDKFKTSKILKQKQLSESTLNAIDIKEQLPETSF
ncbi:hypothetical protein QAD02_006399 [Eretmocerus hayati]|uniref:Uncharacterized protein n=1 Tax=Eretmocerus hayati TaxID=131215 RepID=A0ACC2N327_9HYME|nr:hypothetical protein QAD02_006399 [Eretmocerus hayati]